MPDPEFPSRSVLGAAASFSVDSQGQPNFKAQFNVEVTLRSQSAVEEDCFLKNKI